ncbi:ABC transporter ATP-binding protein [Rhizobium sp. VS19-DR104.2]|uniref:ABC transporter ATP-binding protein n=1 Tax=unclassified Rhizobium TaxID=2613769 RepID=UPI001C5AF064|nr:MULTISPECIES: ABC transporter ATP-binding protein [unclassified Rhizobium]MBZ5763075.1 ABC transporter ATP-binding protein [Rhizobium sp. VS19-DR96]MBZ5768951.1 ABC transporter ATP-binding protein [Rhizobium sp. VS19-DR129.2]MBZ5776569.1 ABC transporter ATP-binding protein [Rhizobium sp. VS19-DRK62.2]MBZ5787692.1 ABC transporter ATP-binding protein [Rhizobium sp. VS19-DR121]MBZ5805065.1 ABC transporter ATP-binding protein [Rhizobium sp. VS19-DR181]
MSRSIVTIRDAGHSYDGQRWLFHNLDFELRSGEILAILGPNGRGKSTLLRALAGLIKLTVGSIQRSGSTGFVPQDFGGSFPYSVLDIVLMGRARHISTFRSPSKADEAIALDALATTGMQSFSQMSFNHLSGGEKQLVLIARALAGENECLLLDEPASALDFKNQAGVLDLMRGVAQSQNLAVAFTTHQPNHALAIADHVLMLFDETEAALGPVGNLMTDENLSALYGIPIRSVTFTHDGNGYTSIVPIFRDRISRI